MDVIDQDADGGAVFVLSERYEAAEEMWHAKPRARLIVASDTVLTLHTKTGRLVAPPRCAVWVLPGVLHRVSSTAGVALRSLYADADAEVVPASCCVVAVDSLADVLLTEAATFGAGYAPDGPQARIVRVLLDHLPELAVVPLSLNWPQDPRTQHIADALVADPADTGVLDDFASAAGVTARTAARLFVKETGLTFGQWRQQLRLLVALEQLGSGESVTQVALRVGYHDVSSFIAVFRQALGETPARYFR
jgi:AraC-like DNA-binding protein